eukprot:scaffold909_cov575-Prasinococcus_capsulatus_cf.AAC.17
MERVVATLAGGATPSRTAAATPAPATATGSGGSGSAHGEASACMHACIVRSAGRLPAGRLAPVRSAGVRAALRQRPSLIISTRAAAALEQATAGGGCGRCPACTSTGSRGGGAFRLPARCPPHMLCPLAVLAAQHTRPAWRGPC